MSDDLEPPMTHPNPRPGVLKTLGICNIVFSVISGVCICWSGIFFFAATSVPPDQPKAEIKVEVAQAPSKKAGVPMSMAINPFMMMQDKNFILWSYVENGTSLLMNGLMLATGIGLVNLRGWAVRWWAYGSWARLVLALLLWGYYIVVVAPGFSETMAKSVVEMFTKQGLPQNRMPPVGELTRVYSIMNLIIAIMAIAITSIYPVISLWLLSRPGVKAAIVDKPVMEPGLP